MKTVLITSGGTEIQIDPVRHFVNWWPEEECDPIGLKNMSHGTFGSMIATEFLKYGQRVIFLCAKHSKRPYIVPFDARRCMSEHDYWFNFETDRFHVCKLFRQFGENYAEIEYDTFDDYAKKLELILKEGTVTRGKTGVFRESWKPDIAVLAAAASDYGVAEHTEKIRSGNALQIQMFPLPKLIGSVKEWCPDITLVGFKLLVKAELLELIAAARKSIETNKCDVVVANDLASIRADNHTIHFVLPNGNVATWTSQGQDRTYLARKVVDITLVRDDLRRS